jgi:ferric-dicitrate binding protein FerR (iron transport regulator)
LAVQCIHGKVKVISNSQKARSYLLEQGDFAQLYTSTEHSPPNAAKQFPLSQQGQSSFYAASFEEVLTKIEIQFNVVVPNKEKYHSRRFTGVFRNEDLELALNMICIPMELKYTIVQDQVYLEDK